MRLHKTKRFYINKAKCDISLTECDKLYLIRGNIQNTQRTHTTQHQKTKIKNEQRACTDILPKRPTDTSKDAQHHFSITNHLGNANQNHKKVYHLHLLQWLLSDR